MKRFVLLVLILITGLTVFSQGIEFQKERYAEVLEMARQMADTSMKYLKNQLFHTYGNN